MSFVLEDGENILPDSSDNEEELEITVSVPIKKNLVDAFNDAELNKLRKQYDSIKKECTRRS